jgi:hypothetical protein
VRTSSACVNSCLAILARQLDTLRPRNRRLHSPRGFDMADF